MLINKIMSFTDMRLKAAPRCRGGSVNDLAPKVVHMRSLGRSKTIL